MTQNEKNLGCDGSGYKNAKYSSQKNTKAINDPLRFTISFGAIDSGLSRCLKKGNLRSLSSKKAPIKVSAKQAKNAEKDNIPMTAQFHFSKNKKFERAEITNDPASAAIVPLKETPPVIPDLCIFQSATEKLFLLKTGPISLAQVSAVTAATKAIKK